MSSIRKEFNQWKKEHGLHGAHAHTRFMMFKFLENLAKTSDPDDFDFKGSNLLWHLIGIKRPTMDLDLSTSEIDEHEVVKDKITKALTANPEVEFTIDSFKEVEQEYKTGGKLIISYKTIDGSSNKFGLDIVYKLTTDVKKVKFFQQEMNAATIENIIIDKLSAHHQFRTGNTRGRDYDDLWHIATSGEAIRKDVLIKMAKMKNIDLYINPNDISPIVEEAYQTHLKRSYRGKNQSSIPKDIYEVFEVINQFLEEVSS